MPAANTPAPLMRWRRDGDEFPFDFFTFVLPFVSGDIFSLAPVSTLG
jgi:hypothetical protein